MYYKANVHTQVLREKVLKWLSNVPNATAVSPDQSNGPKNVVQQQSTSIEKPVFRSTGAKSFSTQAVRSGTLMHETTTNSEFFRYPNTSENSLR